MRRWLKRISLISLLLLGLSFAFALHQNSRIPPSSHYPHLPAASNAAQPGKLSVSFLGVTTLYLDDGQTRILIDGFFSRPSKWQILSQKIQPDNERIAASLKRASIAKLNAVIAVHSHYDHAMDSPEVALQTGASVYGSESTANISRGWGLPESRIQTIKHGSQVTIGGFEFLFINANHAPTGMTGGVISSPLKPPVRFSDYKEGQSYSLIIRHGGKAMLLQGSAGFQENQLAGQKVDIALLGIGTLGQQSEAFKEKYWQQTVGLTQPRLVIPVHWDDFAAPLAESLPPIPWPLDDFGKSMDFLLAKSAAEHRTLKMLPLLQRVDIYSALEPDA